MPVRVVAFDVWNTLLDIDVVFRRIAYIASDRLDSDFQEVLESIASAYSASKALRRYGDVDGFQIIVESQKILARELGIGVAEVIEVIAEALSSIDPNTLLFSDARDALKILSRLGFRMGVIGNVVFWSSVYTRRILKHLGILNYMDTAIFSDELRINKPDRRIFLKFSREMGVEPSYIAYVGDSVIEDVGGALSAGMKAIYIDRGRRERVVLSDIGIAVVTNLLEIVDALDIL